MLGAMAVFGVTVAGATVGSSATAAGDGSWLGATLAGAALFEFPPRDPKPP